MSHFMFPDSAMHSLFLFLPQSHYYQPMWTLVGGGAKTLEQSRKPMSDVMPQGAVWLRTAVSEFNPERNQVLTTDGGKINYDYLIVALGLKVNFDKVSINCPLNCDYMMLSTCGFHDNLRNVYRAVVMGELLS